MAFELDFLLAYDKDSLIKELQRIAKKLGKKTLTWGDIDRHGRVSGTTIQKRWGSMRLAHEAAGLVPPKRRLTDEELLQMLAELWMITYKKVGRSPTTSDLKASGLPVSVDSYTERFGSWNRALMAASKRGSAPVRKVKEKPPVLSRSRTPISVARRFKVFKRDGYTCKMCNRKGGELEVDHVIPRSKGGSDYMDNLQTLCHDCNRGKRGDLQ